MQAESAGHNLVSHSLVLKRSGSSSSAMAQGTDTPGHGHLWMGRLVLLHASSCLTSCTAGGTMDAAPSA